MKRLGGHKLIGAPMSPAGSAASLRRVRGGPITVAGTDVGVAAAVDVAAVHWAIASSFDAVLGIVHIRVDDISGRSGHDVDACIKAVAVTRMMMSSSRPRVNVHAVEVPGWGFLAAAGPRCAAPRRSAKAS